MFRRGDAAGCMRHIADVVGAQRDVPPKAAAKVTDPRVC